MTAPAPADRPPSPPSPITGGPATYAFSADVLGRIPVDYHRCEATGFVFTDPPHWLDEAYASAITGPDVGLVGRNLKLAEFTAGVLDLAGVRDEPCLDYGGGYGLFVRLMRDRGFHFLREDPHCENLFAKGFDVDELPPADRPARFAAGTAFEVLEHLPDPVGSLEPLAERCDLLVCSTELQPAGRPLTGPADWWYVMPETGQHVSLYTRAALDALADRFGMTLYTDGRTRHVFARAALPRDPFAPAPPPAGAGGVLDRVRRGLARRLNPAGNEPGGPAGSGRESLRDADHAAAMAALRRSQAAANAPGGPA